MGESQAQEQENGASSSASHPDVHSLDASVSGLRDKHQKELENLTLATQPVRTIRFFTLAVLKFLQRPVLCTSSKLSWLFLTSTLAAGFGILFLSFRKPYAEELFNYIQFGIWWVALGVASSIGLGSGLHTFVLYLGPHIALFTLKSVNCGRIDIKSAQYDTIQFRRGPSWMDKDCSEYGPPIYSSPDARIPLTSILYKVQMEAMLWGIGTALGELPPYFISRAASISGQKLDMDDMDSSEEEDSGVIGNLLNQIKKWFLLQSRYLNFFTILLLASVPNPLFDLAGIMCGQFGIPFWKFFTATLIGKAIIKTHIQTAFIILLCNNQLLDLVENCINLIPGVASILPNIMTKLHVIKQKYLAVSPPIQSNVKGRKWDLSLASIWNTVVWLMLANFSAKVVNATAQGCLKEQQEKELAAFHTG
ncbi:PREDICTED: vacuole membrane protein KMS1-like isoform X2 [Ipomoea nil]|uniref:vacuole membrane protein KMS1-like isoform X2 n=1 Tax=Ipomoea nil TaxID=35883 RepID=UPI000901B413|nr:PREDICTED: vacuole membrane protein KMS1-like isoform X2 [Ipomoea nil]